MYALQDGEVLPSLFTEVERGPGMDQCSQQETEGTLEQGNQAEFNDGLCLKIQAGGQTPARAVGQGGGWKTNTLPPPLAPSDLLTEQTAREVAHSGSASGGAPAVDSGPGGETEHTSTWKDKNGLSFREKSCPSAVV